jgi:hypothetical protein
LYRCLRIWFNNIPFFTSLLQRINFSIRLVGSKLVERLSVLHRLRENKIWVNKNCSFSFFQKVTVQEYLFQNKYGNLINEFYVCRLRKSIILSNIIEFQKLKCIFLYIYWTNKLIISIFLCRIPTKYIFFAFQKHLYENHRQFFSALLILVYFNQQ